MYRIRFIFLFLLINVFIGQICGQKPFFCTSCGRDSVRFKDEQGCLEYFYQYHVENGGGAFGFITEDFVCEDRLYYGCDLCGERSEILRDEQSCIEHAYKYHSEYLEDGHSEHTELYYNLDNFPKEETIV